jgi:hypothetical protein
LPELEKYNGCELIIDQVQKKCLLDRKQIDFKTYPSYNDKLIEKEKKASTSLNTTSVAKGGECAISPVVASVLLCDIFE